MDQISKFRNQDYKTTNKKKKKVGKGLHELGFGHELMNRIPKSSQLYNIDKLDIIEIKDFCESRDTIKRMKIIHRMGATLCISYT